MSENSDKRCSREDGLKWKSMLESGKYHNPHELSVREKVDYNKVTYWIKKVGYKVEVADRYKVVMDRLESHLDGIRTSFISILRETEKDLTIRVKDALTGAFQQAE